MREFVYSPLIGGFALVLSNGRAAFMTANTLRFDPAVSAVRAHPASFWFAAAQWWEEAQIRIRGRFFLGGGGTWLSPPRLWKGALCGIHWEPWRKVCFAEAADLEFVRRSA